MISEFKYCQTWKIWPSPLSLSLYSTFKAFVDNCSIFRPTLSAINTPTYSLAKFLMRFLKCFTTNKEVVKDSFASLKVILEEDFVFSWEVYMLILLLLIPQLKIQSTFGLIHSLKMLGYFTKNLTEYTL